jgi:hypothetical protein
MIVDLPWLDIIYFMLFVFFVRGATRHWRFLAWVLSFVGVVLGGWLRRVFIHQPRTFIGPQEPPEKRLGDSLHWLGDQLKQHA